MEIKEYQKQSSRTLVKLETPLQDDLHMVLGMQTEAAEIADAYKKHMAYGQELDLTNVREELGDLMWYVANLCNLHGWDLREVMQINIDKLRHRYPEKFDQDRAVNRDLAGEREILEIVPETFHCDGCGEVIFDMPYKDYDENGNLQEGIKLCYGCKYGE